MMMKLRQGINKALSVLVSTCLAFGSLPYQLVAQEINPAGTTNTTVTQSNNGTTVINIARPNGSGVSINDYDSFNVGAGGLVVNNNNRNFGESQTAGIITGNPNLTGESASIIVNQVTGTGRSELYGQIEVSGQSADVIVANPNGVLCDGCGFINTGHATLTTGRVVQDNLGNVHAIDVSGGTIAIGSLGANATGVSLFDILSQRVEIGGTIKGQQVTIVAGRNDVIYATGAVTAKDPEEDGSGTISIDSTVLGGMYADEIKIISTTKGAGVNAPPKMSANAGDMFISADGKLVMGKAQASGNVTAKAETIVVKEVVKSDERVRLEAARALIAEANAVLVTEGALEIKAGESVVLGKGAEIASSRGAATLSGGEVDLGDGARVTAGGGTLNLTAGGALNLGQNAAVLSAYDVKLKAASLNVLEGGLVIAGAVQPDGTQADALLDIEITNAATAVDATFAATGDLRFDAARITIGEDKIAASQFVAGGQMTLVADDATLAGNIAANDHITIDVARRLENEAKLQASGNLTVTAEAIRSTGDLLSAGTLVVRGDRIELNGVVRAMSSVEVSAQSTLIGGAGYATNGKLSLSGGEVSLSGSLQALGDLTIDGDNIALSGDVLSAQDVLINAKAGLLHQAKMSGQNLSLMAAQIENNGVMTGTNKLSLQTLLGNVTNKGTLQSNNELTITAKDQIINSGLVRSYDTGGAITLTASGLSNSGSIIASTYLNGAAGKIENQFGGRLEGAALDLKTASFVNAGAVLGQLTAKIETADLDNKGVIQAVQYLDLATENIRNSGTISASEGRLDLEASGARDLSAGQIFAQKQLNFYTNGDLARGELVGLTSRGSMLISGLNGGNIGTLTLGAGEKLGAGVDLTIFADQIVNDGGALYAATGNLNLKVAGNIQNKNDAMIYAGGDQLSLLLGGSLSNDSSDILASGHILIAGNGFNGTNGNRLIALVNSHEGRIETINGDLYIYADKVENISEAPMISAESIVNTIEDSKHSAYPVIQDYELLAWHVDKDNGLLNNGGCGFGCRGGAQSESGHHIREADLLTTVHYQTELLSATEDPSEIRAGGNLHIVGKDVENAYSSIVAGGDIDLKLDGNLNNISAVYGDQYRYMTTYYHHEWEESGKFSWTVAPQFTTVSNASGSQVYNVFGTLTSERWDISGLKSAYGTIEAGGDITGIVAGDFANGAVVEGSTDIGAGSATESFTAGEAPLSLDLTDVESLSAGGEVEKLSLSGVDTGLTETAITATEMTETSFTYPKDFLRETRHEFINLSAFLSSDYFLGRMGFDADKLQKRLGDAMHETYYVRNQIFEQIGGYILEPGLSEYEQMRRMYDNAINTSEELGLRPGIALTPEQIAALTRDIIWMEEQVVDGVNVLVPRVYLSQPTLDGARRGTNISAGGSINLDVGGSLTNSGGINAGKQLTIDVAGNFTNNGGTLTAGLDGAFMNGANQLVTIPSVMIRVDGDFTNRSGVINGESILVSATSITFDRDLDRFGDGDNYFDQAGRASEINARNNLSLIATNDININGTDVSVGGSAGIVSSEGSVSFGATTLENRFDFESGGQASKGQSIHNLTSTLDIGEELTILAKEDVIFAGTDIVSGGDIDIHSTDGSVVFGAVQGMDWDFRSEEESGLFGSSESTNETYKLTNNVTTLTAEKITISAGKDVTAYGTDFTTKDENGDLIHNEQAADAGTLRIASKSGDISFFAVNDIKTEKHEETSSTLGGLFSSESESESLISSLKGVDIYAESDIDLVAEGGNILVQGGRIEAGGDIHVAASANVFIEGTIDTKFETSHSNNNNGFVIVDKTKIGMEQSESMPAIIAGGDNGFATLENAVIGGMVIDTLTGAPTVGETHTSGLVGEYGPYALLDQNHDPDQEELSGTSSEGSGTSLGASWQQQLKKQYVDDASSRFASITPEGNEYAYLKALTTLETTKIGEQSELLSVDYYQQTVEMGVLSKAALMVLTQGMGTWQSLLVNQFAEAAITGEFDPEALVKAAGMTFLTGGFGEFAGKELPGFAGIGNELKQGLHITDGLGGMGEMMTHGIGGTNYLSGEWLATAAIDTGVNAAASSAIYGTNFTEGFTTSIAGSVIDQFVGAAIDGGSEISGVTSHEAFSLEKALIKATANCLGAEAKGQNCAQAALGTVAAETYLASIPKEKLATMSREEIRDGAERMAIILGAFTSGGDIDNLTTTLTANNLDIDNNYLNYDELMEKINAIRNLEQCLDDETSCSQEEMSALFDKIARLEKIDEERDNAIISACGAPGIDTYLSEGCQSLLGDFRAANFNIKEAFAKDNENFEVIREELFSQNIVDSYVDPTSKVHRQFFEVEGISATVEETIQTAINIGTCAGNMTYEACKAALVDAGIEIIALAGGRVFVKVGGKVLSELDLEKYKGKDPDVDEIAEEAMPSNCFVAGTPVLTVDGYKNIEDIQLGDLIVTQDEEHQMTMVKPVTQLFHNKDKVIYTVTLEDENGKSESLGTTEEHPFYIEGKGWVEVADLEVGDQVLSHRNSKGSGDGVAGFLRIKSVVIEDERKDTYNFEVADTHTYFVGKSRAWVHNACKASEPETPVGTAIEEDTGGGYVGEVHPSTPVGRRDGLEENGPDGTQPNGAGQSNSEHFIPPGTNAPGEFNGRSYSGHAFDRMQQRGIMPSVVEDTIKEENIVKSGSTIRDGKKITVTGGRILYYDPKNNITVITEADGKVVTVY